MTPYARRFKTEDEFMQCFWFGNEDIFFREIGYYMKLFHVGPEAALRFWGDFKDPIESPQREKRLREVWGTAADAILMYYSCGKTGIGPSTVDRMMRVEIDSDGEMHPTGEYRLADEINTTRELPHPTWLRLIDCDDEGNWWIPDIEAVKLGAAPPDLPKDPAA